MRRGWISLCFLAACSAAAALAAEEGGSPAAGPSLEYRPPRPVLPEPKGPTPAPPVVVFRQSFGGFGIGRGSFDKPVDVAFGSDGRTYVLDAGNSRVQLFNQKDNFVLEWGTYGTDEACEFKNPTAIFVVPGTCDLVLVLDTGNNRIQWFQVPCTGDAWEKLPNLPCGHGGSYIKNYGEYGDYGLGDGKFNRPLDIAFEKSHFVSSVFWVLDAGNDRIQKCDLTGSDNIRLSCREQISNLTGSRGNLKGLVSLAWSRENSFDYLNLLGTGCSLQKFKLANVPLLDAAWPAVAPESGLCVPARVRYDERKEYFYVLDSGNSLLSIFHRSGNFISALRGADRTFDEPGGFTLRPESGEFAVADTGNDIVQKFTLR
jgi:hypothetical protein